jgi:hypothetical protein
MLIYLSTFSFIGWLLGCFTNTEIASRNSSFVHVGYVPEYLMR